MKFSHHQIAAFAAVGREKSFSVGATRLGIGQSAVTQHIAALESRIGAKLFVRNRAGAELTATGRELFGLADQIQVLEEQFTERASQVADLQTGRLSICVSTPRPAMALVSAFRQRYPGVTVDLTVAPWKTAQTLLSQRTIDLAIIVEPEQRAGLWCQEIGQHRFVAILPASHKFAGEHEISVADLVGETLIMLSDDSYTSYWMRQKLNTLDMHPTNQLKTSSYEMMIEAVLHGMGVSMGLQGTFAAHTGLRTVDVREFTEWHSFSVVCPEDKAALRIVRRFMALAVETAEMPVAR